MSARTVVIILNWNNHQMTANCIRSLLPIDAKTFDVVVIDNGSQDESVQCLTQEFPQITVLPQASNLGFAAGCNVGIRHALACGAEYILLLNNDTYAGTGFMLEMLSRMEDDPRIAVVCPKIYFADRPNLLWYAGADFSLWTGSPKHRGWKQIDREQFDRDRDITQATGCAMLVRCSAIRHVGLFDEQFWSYAEDLDWSLRFLKHGYRLAYAPKARLWHYDGATSVKLMGSGSQRLRQFFSTRNMVFVARKHLRWFQIPTYVAGFAVNNLAFYTFLRIWRRDFQALLAVYKGLNQGLRTPLNSSRLDECMDSERLPAQTTVLVARTEDK